MGRPGSFQLSLSALEFMCVCALTHTQLPHLYLHVQLFMYTCVRAHAFVHLCILAHLSAAYMLTLMYMH